MRQKPGVMAPIVGYSRPDQLDDIPVGLDLVLTAEQVARLEEAYVPRSQLGHYWSNAEAEVTLLGTVAMPCLLMIS